MPFEPFMNNFSGFITLRVHCFDISFTLFSYLLVAESSMIESSKVEVYSSAKSNLLAIHESCHGHAAPTKCKKCRIDRNFLTDIMALVILANLIKKKFRRVWGPYLIKNVDLQESVRRRATKMIQGLEV